MTEPFRFLLRVRYGECDAQGIVFNARWVEYVDVAVTEYTRAMFGSVDPAKTGVDWRLVKQTCEWKAPGHYDDVLDIRVRTIKIGTTSFVVATEFHRDGVLLVTAETVYVMVDRAGAKQAVPERYRGILERGAPGIVIDQSGST